ncbi:hypothetical protein EKO04_011511 [Ascochyta lentis]|uniref:Uncharacterized protein n=1 Tax=Ascochyta lentis TaxID=205686 RepID=A0A8H7MBE3_9PLEO|nr:hypothetical protein EKO04_011511 [Ascochyta lentis]
MVTTRSKTAQTHIEDFAREKGVPQLEDQKLKGVAPKANSSRKRKSDNTINEEPAAKRTKAAAPKQTPAKAEDDNDSNTKPVIINRAPVLHLWAASVAHRTHPQLSWETCLSAGAAVSAICAVAKGRSIGTVPETEDGQDGKESVKNRESSEELEVMHFKLKLRDGVAVVGSEKKGSPGNEEALRKKFGPTQYQSVKTAFGNALQSWEGEEGELNRQKGWGRKAELKLEVVERVVKR